MAGSATYPLARSRGNAGSRRCRGAFVPPVLIGILLAIVFFPVPAHAISAQGMIAIGKWKAMDSCAIEAQRAFPDFTAESNAKRDARLRECLARQNLPPREAQTPSR